MNSAQARLFVALWPDDRTLCDLIAFSSELDWSGDARPKPAERLHVTVAFIGNVPRSQIENIADSINLGSVAFEFDLCNIENWDEGHVVITPAQPLLSLINFHNLI